MQPLDCFFVWDIGMVLEESTDDIKPEPSSESATPEFHNSENCDMTKKTADSDEFDHLLSVRISATSRVLGFIWFILTYLFVPEPPNILVPAIIFIGVGSWCVWEVYWHSRWRRQEKDASHLMNSFGECLTARSLLKDLDSSLRDDPNSLLPSSYNKRVTDVLKAIQNLASDIAIHTNHTALRYFIG